MQSNLEHRAWWTTLDDFEGGWCPCAGINRKLPNVIVNTWYRQSGKTNNLCKLAIDYWLKYPERNIGICTFGNTKHIIEKMRNEAESQGIDIATAFADKKELGNIYILSQNNSKIHLEKVDLLLLDEFYFFGVESMKSIAETWNYYKKGGVIIAWSTPSSDAEKHDKILRNLRLKGGTRMLINYFSYYDNEDNKDKDIPSYLGEAVINTEYHLDL